MGDTPGKNLGKPDDPVPVLVMLQKQGWSTSCYASTRRINSCMQKFQSKQGDRSKDISLLDEPKDVDSTDSHTQKSIVFSPSPQQCTPPSMDRSLDGSKNPQLKRCIMLHGSCSVRSTHLKQKFFFWGSETGISSFWKRSRFSEEIKDLASTQKSKIKESTSFGSPLTIYV